MVVKERLGWKAMEKPERPEKADGPDGRERGFSLPRFALVLVAVAIAHFTTAVGFGHSVPNALGALAEDMVVLVVVISAAVYVRSRMRRSAPGR